MAKPKKIIIKKEDPFCDPRCCTYKLSGDIRNYVDKLINSETIEPETKSILVKIIDEDEANKNTLTYESLVNLHKYIQRADRDYLDPFHLFASQCKCIKPKPRDNKQLDERLKLLRLKNSQSLYDSMASSVDKSFENRLEKHEDSDNLSSSKVYSDLSNSNGNRPSEFRKLNGTIVAVFNSFLVFISTFIFCYKALEYSLHEPNVTAQILFGIGGSTIVAIAELYFLIRVI